MLPEIELIRPVALWLIPLPWLFWALSKSQSATASLIVPERMLTFLRQLDRPGRQGSANSRIRWALAYVGWLALVLALAGPLGSKIPLPEATGRDLLVVLDLSASMQAQDVRLGDDVVSRVEAVKILAGSFIRGRDGDRVGLIVFANEPFLIAPLTYDVAAVSSYLDEVAVGLPGRKTAIGDAITLGVQQLSRDPGSSKVLMLLTDGVSNAGAYSPSAAAQMALSHDIRIHTIGFGGHLSGESEQIGKELQGISSLTNGRYFPAPSADALREVYRSLDALEPTRSDRTVRFIQQDLTWPALWVALGLMLLCTLLDWRVGRL